MQDNLPTQIIDLITPLENLKTIAENRLSPLTGTRSDFIEGYLMAINHAIELATIHQLRLELRHSQEAK